MSSNKMVGFQKSRGFAMPVRRPVDRTRPAREVSVIRKRSSREYVNQPLLNIRVAASHLGRSERLIRRLVQEHRIAFVQLAGTRVRYLEFELDQWFVGQLVGTRR